jgi:signal transduction histidine kinase
MGIGRTSAHNLGWACAAREEDPMSPSWDDSERERGRRGRGRARFRELQVEQPGAGDPDLHGAPASPPASRPRRKGRRSLTPEERAYREARRAANRKIGFLSHLVPYGAVCLFLLFVTGFRVATIVALSWGIAVALHYFFAILAPRLRQEIIQHEVRQQVQSNVSEQKRTLEGRHAQHVEELSASIAHEIRNPITAAKSLVQQMGEDPASPDNVEYANVALEELQRVEKSISHLLRFAREEDVEITDVCLADVVDSALETFRDRIAEVGVRIEQDLSAVSAMRADPDKLRRVIINLVGNALDAFEGQHISSPRLQIRSGENLAGTEIWIRVKDNGPGIAPEKLDKIFSPFYTSKSSGTGLGLAISKKLVDAHGGSIEAQSSPGSGTEFLLTFPARGGEAVERET